MPDDDEDDDSLRIPDGDDYVPPVDSSSSEVDSDGGRDGAPEDQDEEDDDYTCRDEPDYYFIATPTDTYVCRLCATGPSYKVQGGLTRHLKSIHNLAVKFRCAICRTKFDTVKATKAHQQNTARCNTGAPAPAPRAPRRPRVVVRRPATPPPRRHQDSGSDTLATPANSPQRPAAAPHSPPSPPPPQRQRTPSPAAPPQPANEGANKHWSLRFQGVAHAGALDMLVDELTAAVIKKCATERPPRQQRRQVKPDAPPRQPRPQQRRPRQGQDPPPRYDPKAASRIQKLYRKCRPRAFKEITEETSPFCQIPAAELQRHFEAVFGPEHERDLPDQAQLPPPVPTLDPLPDEQDNPFKDDYSNAEVWDRLRFAKNTAPGPDGIRYAFWRKFDPGGRILTAMMNAVRRVKHIPKAWNESRTILLHKKGTKDDVTNWRPISLSNTAAKLYASVMAKRLGRWAILHQRISSEQKGFMPVDGCAEHNFLLQAIIVEARRDKRIDSRASISWLDLSNAFGSVPHPTLFRCMKYAGLNDDAIDEVRRLYKNSTTTIRSATGPTAAIPIQSGVKQGCPLSPIIFNLALEPLIRAVAHLGLGFPIEGRQVGVLAYADDLAVITKDPQDLHHALDVITEVASWLGLKFNAKKCASLVIDGSRNEALKTQFRIQGSPMATLDKEDHYEHLGVPTGYYYGKSAETTINKMHKDLDKIHDSLLAPWQKADAVRTFILPCIGFHLKNGEVEKKKVLIPFDKKLKKYAKSWLNLPSRASPELLYLPNSMGGLGLIETKTLADIMQLVHAVQLLDSPDLGAMSAELVTKAAKIKLRRPPTEQETAQYLNQKKDGDFYTNSSDAKNVWSRLRLATGRLRDSDKLDIEWRWDEDEGRVRLHVQGEGVNKKNCERALKKAAQEAQLASLTAKKSQGKTYQVMSRQPTSNYFMRDGRFLRFADWRFVHRARLDLLALNGCNRSRGHVDKRCRKCGYALESVAHTLNHCHAHSHAIQLRHNAVLDRLMNAYKPLDDDKIYVNQKIPGTDGQLRPDYTIINDRLKTITIIDVTMPFENGDVSIFEDARREKERKYLPILDKYSTDGYDTFLGAWMVGPLGGWDAANNDIQRRLKISVKYGQLMRLLMVADSIRWSRDIYVEHVTGQRQYKLDDPQ